MHENTRAGQEATDSSTKEIPPCIYELKGEDNHLTMRIMCKGCSKRDLKDRTCFSSLLRAFASNTNVDKITLADHVETQYFGKALSILKGITALSYEMRQLSIRTPYGRNCKGCEFHPKRIFMDLNENFLRDVGLFYSIFQDRTVRLFEADKENPTCEKCLHATREYFDYIYGRFDTLLKEIVKEGYAVVV